MSLKEAVLEIAQDMEEKAGSACRVDPEVLISYSKALRMVVKAAGSEPAPRSGSSPREATDLSSEAAQAFGILARKIERAEQQVGEVMIEFGDGPSRGDMILAPASMPVGACTRFGGQVYKLGPDRKLYLQEAVV